MYLSRIRVTNFRNFRDLDIELEGNVVVVGENRVGKTNLIHALRIIFDAALPDSARLLDISDFSDGHTLGADSEITILVEIKGFEDNLSVLALLTDYRLDDDPDVVRLTFKYRPNPSNSWVPQSQSDFEFICFGGSSEDKEFGYELRRRICLDVLPALRDAEGDLSGWRSSPLRPLIDTAFADIDDDDLEDVAKAISEATSQLTEFDEVKNLADSIRDRFKKMSGEKQDINTTLGFAPTERSRLKRSLRLMIDGGVRSISDASLGSANIVFLALKLLEQEGLMEDDKRDFSFLAIEEPEAHLHPHLQRSVYRDVFERVDKDEDKQGLSVFLTTHSPHIASVAPLKSLVLLRETSEGTKGRSIAGIKLSKDDHDDLARYLDVTRAEMLFSRGVILVEGDAERFLIPVFANSLGISLDGLGISVCSVAGTNFLPYIKLLEGLSIPFAVISDWDPREEDADDEDDDGEDDEDEEDEDDEDEEDEEDEEDDEDEEDEEDEEDDEDDEDEDDEDEDDEDDEDDDDDSDEDEDIEAKKPLGYKRLIKLVRNTAILREGSVSRDLARKLATDRYNRLSDTAEEWGFFFNNHTLEIDIFDDDDLRDAICDTLSAAKPTLEDLADKWKVSPGTLDKEKFLRSIEAVGKGRFAQRLATAISGIEPPWFIRGAIEFVVERVK